MTRDELVAAFRGRGIQGPILEGNKGSRLKRRKISIKHACIGQPTILVVE